jgi:signal transduction histidine kinase
VLQDFNNCYNTFDIHQLREKINEIEKFIKMGIGASNQLQGLIEDILDLSKMESGIFQINHTDFVIKPLIKEIVEIFEYQWEMKKLKLKWNVDDKLNSLVVSSDRDRIKQVLQNILSNSLKYTFKGSITIDVAKVQKFNRNFIEFCVKDSGIGIREENQKNLYKLFENLPEDDGINSNGWGIGLTISKKYVEALNGEIILNSLVDKGTTVTFTIPIVVSEDSNIFGALEEEWAIFEVPSLDTERIKSNFKYFDSSFD